MIDGGFRPTHLTPPGGVLTWDTPDPSRAATHRLDPDLRVQALEETTGWARVRCSNGWETWVAVAELVAIPFRPTRTIPTGGSDARVEPVANRLPDAHLAAGLPVEIVEESQGWAHVRCSNGWEAWVDGRALVSRRQTPVAALNPLSLVAVGLPAALVILGSFLAWFSFRFGSFNAWDIEVVGLFTHDSTSFELKTGPVLLVLALAALALIVVPLSPRIVAVALAGLGGAVFVLGVAGVLLQLDFGEPRPDLGIGLLLTIAGGLALGIAGFLVFWPRERA